VEGQLAGRRVRDQLLHRVAARALAEDEHLVRVAAEAVDVLRHPGQRLALVEEAQVGLAGGDLRGRGEAEDWARQSGLN
jgi:hypothetical protein